MSNLESLILVDEFGKRKGSAERHECHLGCGMRHRAFVIFLTNTTGSLLIQKRQRKKLGGGRWDVSATSHVRSDETYAAAIRRCLSHELGITQTVIPTYLLSYTYAERLESYSENEYCSLFTMPFEGTISPNPEELENYNWVSVAELASRYCLNSKLFTRWFGEAFERFIKYPSQI